MEVETGPIFLKKIPHEGKEITFLYPAYRGSYGEVAEKIDKTILKIPSFGETISLKRPSSGEIASLIDDAWKNSRGEYEHKILDIMMVGWLWEYTGNLYLPKSNEEASNGVIIEHNPTIVNGKLSMDKNSLVQRLKEDDPLVKFVPFGYKIGVLSFRDLLSNPYILARYGNEGAEKIARISLKYKGIPMLYSFDNVEKEKSVMSGLDNARDNTRLIVGGDVWNYISYGQTFAVCKDESSLEAKK
jgi:hypothetical protein